MTQDSTEERRRKHMAVMDDGKENWQSEAMHQNALLHDALTRAEVAEAKLDKAVTALRYVVSAKGLTDPSEYGYEAIKHARIALAEIKGE
jgi:hypothetical protein